MSTDTLTEEMLPASWSAEAKCERWRWRDMRYTIRVVSQCKPIVPRNPNVAFTIGLERMAHCRSFSEWGFQAPH